MLPPPNVADIFTMPDHEWRGKNHAGGVPASSSLPSAQFVELIKLPGPVKNSELINRPRTHRASRERYGRRELD
jgi:hypothetical protein